MSIPTLPAFAWPGGYPIRYLAYHETDPRHLLQLCPCCAASLASMGELTDTPQADIAWEGPADACDDCGTELPTAYGDPEETP